MDVDKIVAAFRYEIRNVVWQGEVVEKLPHVTRRSTGIGLSNYITSFDLNESNADEQIRLQIEHFKNAGRDFEWKTFSFDLPSDLNDRLRAAGFTVGNREAVVIYDLSSGLGPFEGPFNCDVRLVESFSQLDEFRSVAESVFCKDYSFTTAQLAEALEAGRTGHDAYVAYVGDDPVSIGRLYTDPNSAFAGLYGGGTLPAYRGQGCYRAVTAARAHTAHSRGARYVQVDALPTSLPILLRLGFVKVADTWPCSFA